MLVRKKLRQDQVLARFATLPRCVVAMEACARTRYWAREIAALGHAKRLIPLAYVKPFVQWQGNDMADAEAICKARMLGRECKTMNLKKIYRLYRHERLAVRKRGGRRRALGRRAPMTLPQRLNQRWSLDFVSDALGCDRRFRVLNVIEPRMPGQRSWLGARKSASSGITSRLEADAERLRGIVQ